MVVVLDTLDARMVLTWRCESSDDVTARPKEPVAERRKPRTAVRRSWKKKAW